MKENNILISNFLGLQLQEDNTYYDNESNEYINQEDLNYNESWDMLMQVVDKIESLLPDDNVITIEYKDCIIPVTEGFTIETNGDTKIETVYNACIEFIKWWNNKV